MTYRTIIQGESVSVIIKYRSNQKSDTTQYIQHFFLGGKTRTKRNVNANIIIMGEGGDWDMWGKVRGLHPLCINPF